jgi:ribosomal protein S8
MDHIQLLNKIKVGYLKGQTQIRCKIFRGLPQLISLFFKAKLITGYYKHQKYIYILLKYDINGRPIFNNIRIISKTGHRRFLTKRKIQALQYVIANTSWFLLRHKRGFELLDKRN